MSEIKFGADLIGNDGRMADILLLQIILLRGNLLNSVLLEMLNQ